MGKSNKKTLPDHKALIESLKLCELSTENLNELESIAKQQRAKKISACKAEIDAILETYTLDLKDVYPPPKAAKPAAKPVAK
ncbi:MAG: hypothetical protein HQL69_17630 [Magnetococcales bacterium]|nr:hypothetical protein [Magnetococcales bacterium]